LGFIYQSRTAGVTVDLQVKFLKAVSTIHGAIAIKGKIINQTSKLVTIATRLLDHDGNVCSTGTVIYRVFPPNIAVEKLGYPGIKAFYAD
jgi:acyl-coenzyme A thioesterase PaaI-like protein